MPETEPACHLCGASALEPIAGYAQLARVTSDCKPWPNGGRLSVCRACGGIQKPIDERWRRDAAVVYDGYAIYHQSGGAEQAVYDARTGTPSPRSVRLIERLRAAVPLPERGRLLDVGCGNGAFLRAASDQLPGWSLRGTEVNDRYRAVVESIPRVEALDVGNDLPAGAFDLVSLIHVLEHVDHPRAFLARIADRLSPGGLLMVEVPNHLENAFDLLIVDHASHFTLNVLAGLIAASGFELVATATNWVTKELTVVARCAGQPTAAPAAAAPTAAGTSSHCGLDWLRATADLARREATGPDFGIFGTSIGATWLRAEVDDRVAFYVDEDPNRVGKQFMGRPILHPRDVPTGGRVFLALPTALAASVAARLARPGVTYLEPPAKPA